MSSSQLSAFLALVRRVAMPDRLSADMCSQAVDEVGHHLLPVRDQADVAVREDLCGRIGVDRHDGAGPAGTGQVVQVAGQSDGQVDAGSDAASGDADLAAV